MKFVHFCLAEVGELVPEFDRTGDGDRQAVELWFHVNQGAGILA